MSLLSGAEDRTTSTAGFFGVTSAVLAEWIREAFSKDPESGTWRVRPTFSSSQEDAVALIPVSTVREKLLIASLGEWSVLLTDGPLGTDLGVLPARAADRLGCVVIAAKNVGPGAMYPVRVLDYSGPGGVERTIVAANDGGRWVFSSSGEPFEFEDLEAYTRRRKADRFTGEMLHEYLRQLGVPIDDEPDWSNALLVERVS